VTKIAEALKRVLTRQDPDQAEPVIVEIDRSGGADVLTIVYDPDQVDEQALEGYKLKAAISSSLEGFGRYHRTVQGHIGTYDADQLLFDQALERASTELEELVHLAPRQVPTPAQAKALVKGWLTDEKTRAALATLFETGGDDGGERDGDAESTTPGSPNEDGAQSGSRRTRRSSS